MTPEQALAAEDQVGTQGCCEDTGSVSIEQQVKKRYAAGAEAVQPQLCCPVDYDPTYLEVIPEEIISKDYGCGDPSTAVQDGETVLDLGSGGGKICYIASQRVGAQGRVIGVDFNDVMLDLARKHQADVAEKIGWNNVSFRKGRIQDLRLDLEKVEAWLGNRNVRSTQDLLDLEAEMERLRNEEPLIPDDSIDVVVSNCVLNLVRPEMKKQLMEEIYRVLRNGGRAVISDIVSDEDVPQHLQDDPELWSGCISGAWREDLFLQAFEDVGFYGVNYEKYESEPWQTVEGIEFRSVTVVAWKGKEGPCYERNQAVIYGGPWRCVYDDDGHMYQRGVRTAVCDKTYQIMMNEPYVGQMIPVDPIEEHPLEGAPLFDCSRTAVRHPRETKGLEYNVTTEASDCSGDTCC
jgi:ubiquinone/menaquinone biosynthesis C-methylase UbiE